MKDNLRAILQSLFIPAALALIGYWFNASLQKQQDRLDKIKFSDQIINEVFDTTNIPRALAHLELLPLVINDQKLDSTLTQMVQGSLLNLAALYASEGNDSAYKQISDAVQFFNGKKAKDIGDSLMNNPKTERAEKAKKYAHQGISLLNQGHLYSARKMFEKADSTNPGIGSNHEIYKFFQNDNQPSGKSSDSSKVALEVLDRINKNFSWKTNFLHARKE